MKIKQDTLITAVVALLVGIVLGGLASGQGLFGTASDSSNTTSETVEIDPSRFYKVTFEEAQGWLTSNSDDNLDESLSTVAGLANAGLDLGQYFVDSEDSVDTVLFSLQNALLSEDVDENTANAVTTCIGVDSNPYSPTGPGLYVYVEVPDGVDVPDEFQDNTVSTPQESSITWAASCIKGSDAGK